MIKITLRNYRSYSAAHPAEFVLGAGFTGFVGKNNSGKSTCLRAIYELRQSFHALHPWLGGATAQHDLTIPSEPDPSAILNFNNEDPAFVSIEVEPAPTDGSIRLRRSTMRLTREGRYTLESLLLDAPSGEISLKAPFIESGGIEGTGLLPPAAQVSTVEVRRVQYSAATMAAAVQTLGSCVYYGPYRNVINQGAGQHYDLAVGTALIESWDRWKAGGNVSHKRAIGRVEEDIARLIGAASVEINASADNSGLDVKVDKHPFKLTDLGAGVSELVITFANALIRRPTFILIDEPESHLHPSLQIDFLTTLAGYSQFGVAYSSHSLGLVRTLSDRTYVVQRLNKESSCVPLEKNARLAEVLGSLSFSGHFPLGGGKILLVEGASEVRVMHVFLRKLGIEHEVIVLPLGGTQLIRSDIGTELGEVLRIAGSAENVIALVDSERVGEDEELSAERRGFVEACAALGIRLLVTARRATENYFSDAAVKRALGQSYRSLGPHEALRDTPNGWAKSANWRIAEAESEDFFRLHDFGGFLLSLKQ